MHWTAAIIAGGPASRLGGRDKSSLCIGGRSILDRQLAVLRPLTDRVLVVANDRERFLATGLPVVADVLPGAGALGGIYTALRSATTDRVLALACDMPFVSARFLELLQEQADGVDLAIARSADGYQPLCALYSQGCTDPIRRRIARRSLRVQDLAAEVRTREIGPEALAACDPSGLLFFNINTPEDLERARQLADRLEPGSESPADRIMQDCLPSGNGSECRRPAAERR